MSQFVLTSKGTVVPRRTLQKLTTEELYSPTEISKRKLFDQTMTTKLGNSISGPTNTKYKKFVAYHDNHIPDNQNLSIENDPVSIQGVSVFENPITDTFIDVQLRLATYANYDNVKVISKVIDVNGEPIGKYNENPHLNTILYNVEFSDGLVTEYSANVIAENKYQTVDSYGHNQLILDEIIDFRKGDNAVKKEDGFVNTQSGYKRMQQTTEGWDMFVIWRGDTQ